MSLKQALKRPDNYNNLSSRQQWEIDKQLGILDWEPTEEDIRRYKKILENKLKEPCQSINECNFVNDPSKCLNEYPCGRKSNTQIKDQIQTISCHICGLQTPMLGTKLCDRCWELESRIIANPELAKKIIASLENKNKGHRTLNHEKK
jgi:hypothetical protein